ncbi:MAG: hypothetical protein EXQ70_03555 [Solirubrobacterales bacterium]|nr:hypothetical protein [Solirubrobacterales bacterium]
MSEPSPLRKPVPGRLFRWVKIVSWVELVIFAALLLFWLAPGFDQESFIFGMGHGIGYLALCLLILVAVFAREAPWPLLAATLTPVGPLGSVIGIALIEHRGLGVEEGASAEGLTETSSAY